MAYRSDFSYTPDPRNSPCKKVVECQHKQLTKGICRNSCKEYNDYENIMEESKDQLNEYKLLAKYRYVSLGNQERKAR
jgi:hypothetical protein